MEEVYLYTLSPMGIFVVDVFVFLEIVTVMID